jgi:dolichol-phosphate mannosyltransferase
MSKIFIVIPTYNEANNLPVMASELFNLGVEGLEILVVDDASPDGTGNVADGLAKQYIGKFHVIHREGKLGLGTAYIRGFKYALSQAADFVIQMDADFSHSPGIHQDVYERDRPPRCRRWIAICERRQTG